MDRPAPLDRRAQDAASETPRWSGGEGPVVRSAEVATAIVVGAAAAAAAVVRSNVQGNRTVVEGGVVHVRPATAAPMLATAIMAAAVEGRRGTLAAARLAQDGIDAATRFGYATPLGWRLDRARARFDAWARRIGAEPDEAIERASRLAGEVIEEISRQVMRRIDVDELMRSVDVNALASRMDLQSMLERVDLNPVVDRLDVDQLAARVDVEAFLARLDLAAIAREVLDRIQIERVIRESTASLSMQTVDELRARGADADRSAERFVDRILRRGRERDVRGPVDVGADGAASPPEAP